MSNKLNAGELAVKRYPEIEGATNIEAHFQDGCKAGYFFAIEEVAQPLADERDELREALNAIIAQWDTPNWKLTEPTGAIIANARAILAKYPKP
jgi:hypothetical protein